MFIGIFLFCEVPAHVFCLFSIRLFEFFTLIYGRIFRVSIYMCTYTIGCILHGTTHLKTHVHHVHVWSILWTYMLVCRKGLDLEKWGGSTPAKSHMVVHNCESPCTHVGKLTLSPELPVKSPLSLASNLGGSVPTST